MDVSEAAVPLGLALSILCVFLMQIGFAMLETGAAMRRNAQNVLMKNMVDACAVSLAFWLCGWALSGGSGTRVVGHSQFATAYTDGAELLKWSVEWVFCLNAATIFGGSAAGRTRFIAFVCVASSVGAVTYPLAARWVWHEEGFLRRLGDVGVLDFSGSGVVHMLGGTVGLVVSVALNPRLLRVKDGAFVPVPSHNVVLGSLGVMLLWAAWYAFNTLPILALPPAVWVPVYARVLINTTLGAVSAGMAIFVWDRARETPYRLPEFGNCVLSGLVAITAPCAFVAPWAAVVIGVLATGVFTASSNLLVRLRIDDPLNAFPIHGACGLLGLLSAGVFARQECVEEVYGVASTHDYGFVYGGRFRQFGYQVVAAVVLVVWAAAVTVVVVLALRWRGMLQVGQEAELQGQDTYKHGSRAYPEFAFPPEDDVSEDRASLEDRETWRAQEMLGFAVEPRSNTSPPAAVAHRHLHLQQQQQQYHRPFHPSGNNGTTNSEGGYANWPVPYNSSQPHHSYGHHHMALLYGAPQQQRRQQQQQMPVSTTSGSGAAPAPAASHPSTSSQSSVSDQTPGVGATTTAASPPLTLATSGTSDDRGGGEKSQSPATSAQEVQLSAV